jgi:hypothetical protein
VDGTTSAQLAAELKRKLDPFEVGDKDVQAEEWLFCNDWRPMLAFLSSRLTKRKSMLYVCAGLRSLWHLLFDTSSQRAVEVAERTADGKATEDEIYRAAYSAECPTFGFNFEPDYVRKWIGMSSAIHRLIEMGVYSENDLRSRSIGQRLGDASTRSRLLVAARIAEAVFYHVEDGKLDEDLLEHLSNQKEWPGGWLVREMVGNPFYPIAISASWLSWNDSTVVRLAQATYDERILPEGKLDNTRLAVLADALEESGCTDEQILGHLRSGGDHYRGCFVVDALLGKS